MMTYITMTEPSAAYLALQSNIGVLEKIEKEITDPTEKEKWAEKVDKFLKQGLVISMPGGNKNLYIKMANFSIEHLTQTQEEKWADRVYNSLIKLPQFIDDKYNKIECLQLAREISEFYERTTQSKEIKDKWHSRVEHCENELDKLL